MDSPQSTPTFRHIDTPPEDDDDSHSHDPLPNPIHVGQLLGVIAGFCAMVAWFGFCGYLAWQFLKPFIYLVTHSPLSSTTLL